MNNILEALHDLATKQLQHTELYNTYDTKALSLKAELELSLNENEKHTLAILLDHCETLLGLATLEAFKSGVSCGFNLSEEINAYVKHEDYV